jgi:MFS family permease
MILDVAGAQDRGRWTGLYETWFFLGAALGTFAGGLLTDRLGYTTALWIGAGLTTLGGLVALVLLPETRGIRSGDPLPEGPRLRLRANRGLWVAASCHAVNRFCTAGVLVSTMALVVQDRLSTLALAAGAATLTGVLLAGRTLFSTAAAPLAGWASDRLRNRWTVAAVGLVLGAAGMGLLAWGTPAAILAGIALGSLSTGSLQSVTSALTGDLVAPEQRGRAIGLVHTAGDLGSALGPMIAYALLPWLGLPIVYLLCAMLFAAQVAPVLWVRGVLRPASLAHEAWPFSTEQENCSEEND